MARDVHLDAPLVDAGDLSFDADSRFLGPHERLDVARLRHRTAEAHLTRLRVDGHDLRGERIAHLNAQGAARRAELDRFDVGLTLSVDLDEDRVAATDFMEGPSPRPARRRGARAARLLPGRTGRTGSKRAAKESVVSSAMAARRGLARSEHASAPLRGRPANWPSSGPGCRHARLSPPLAVGGENAVRTAAIPRMKTLVRVRARAPVALPSPVAPSRSPPGSKSRTRIASWCRSTTALQDRLHR